MMRSDGFITSTPAIQNSLHRSMLTAEFMDPGAQPRMATYYQAHAVSVQSAGVGG